MNPVSTLTETLPAPICECGHSHDNKNIEMSWDEYEAHNDLWVYIARVDCPYLDRAAITVLFENDRFLVYQVEE